MMALAVLIALTPMGIYGLKLWREGRHNGKDLTE
jgi:hypothetical protein